MDVQLITSQQIANRRDWVERRGHTQSNFGEHAGYLAEDLAQEIQVHGLQSLLGHLRLCGAIPERYGHDSSAEKLYAKYTDSVLQQAFAWMGFATLVLKERSGVADVECVSETYSFVADAKSFRLSRTAKNQKDFKIQAMDNWKHGKPYAIVVCPIYQLPSKASQIYQQAAARSVCIATYTHLAVLVRYAQASSQTKARQLLHEVLQTVEAMHPAKDAVSYWQSINRAFLQFDPLVGEIWREEKRATEKAILVSKEEALIFLAAERERIMKLSREEAIHEILKRQKLDNRVRAVQAVADNGLLGVQ